jgi:tetratricopeptide (TPR) repeat protein
MLPRMTRTRRHRLALACSLALAAGGPAARAAESPPPAAESAAQAPAAAEREAAYRAFRREFDAERYNEALPHAERVVSLTESLDAHHPDLATALNNLGATHYRLGDHLAAEQAYGRALALVEEAHGALARQLVVPLRGLALTYQSAGHHDFAVPLLERAVAISRRSNGLFNPAQKELLTPLVDGYAALGRWKDADRVQQYALQISEHQYGTSDPRLFPALQQLGRWYAGTAQRNAARRVWERLLAISSDAAHPDPIGQIVALRGIAEAYRLDYQFGAEPPEQPRPGEPPPMREPLEFSSARQSPSMIGPEYVLSSAGQDALEKALALAEKIKPPPTTALAVVLVDLGDWHLVAGRLARALPYYRRALPLIPAETGSAEAAGGPLSRPSTLLYRPPPASMRHRDQPASLYVEKYAVAEFSVTGEGRVREAKIVEGDASDAQRAAFLGALAHAIFRPRFVDGKPVATDKVRYRESFRQLKS